MKTVWIVTHRTAYEDCSYIMGVFSFKELAIKCVEKTNYEKVDEYTYEFGSNYITVLDYELNVETGGNSE